MPIPSIFAVPGNSLPFQVIDVNLLGRDFDFLFIAKREDKHGQKGADGPPPAIHQMCQIRAKPLTTAKNTVMKPVALFFGISIGSNLRSFAGWACCVCSRCFLLQRASRSVTCGSTAKFQAGGGEAVAYSSVRPFHGSSVTFNCSRSRIATTSWTTWQTIPARMTTTPIAATTNHGCQLATS
jgi:hypothetical protein